MQCRDSRTTPSRKKAAFFFSLTASRGASREAARLSKQSDYFQPGGCLKEVAFFLTSSSLPSHRLPSILPCKNLRVCMCLSVSRLVNSSLSRLSLSLSFSLHACFLPSPDFLPSVVHLLPSEAKRPLPLRNRFRSETVIRMLVRLYNSYIISV
jgi:hypothetical protein